MPWNLWQRHGGPVNVPPLPAAAPRVTVNRHHGSIGFNRPAVELIGITEGRVEILYDLDEGLLGFRPEREGQGYALTRDRQLSVAKLLREVKAISGQYEPTLVDGVWAVPCLPPKGRQE